MVKISETQKIIGKNTLYAVVVLIIYFTGLSGDGYLEVSKPSTMTCISPLDCYIYINVTPQKYHGDIYFDTDISRQQTEYRLIYFARRRRNMGCGGEAPCDTDTYFVGFQTTIDGLSQKRMISVCDLQIKFVNQ